ncbi:MAG: tRNA-dihydrouridine synthase [Clostridia bacterium]|nr:tRNA-dihydrouridine synthase [Clostridia bacterium]
MNTRCEWMGLSLKNPLIAAAGPWSDGHESIQKAIDHGAAAVVTETITQEESGRIYPRIYVRDNAVLNTTLYSTRPLEAWEEELQAIDKKGSYVICNIRGTTPSEAAYIARRMERWGADGLELCPYTPIGAKIEGIGANPEDIHEMIHAVTRAVELPVTVRLPIHMANTPAFVKAVERAGAKSISTIESLKALWGVDVEKRRSYVPTFGGYTGGAVYPITLATVATLKQSTDCDIAAMGGIRSAENVLECIMLGASAVQIGSSILMNGYDVFGRINAELEKWTESHGVSGFDEICGAALTSLASYEEIDSKPKHAVMRNQPVSGEDAIRARGCCLAGAIRDDLSIDEKKCNGCGLCASILPGAYEMR